MKNFLTLSADLELQRAKEEYVCNALAKKHYKKQDYIDLRKYKAFLTKENLIKQFLSDLGFKDFKSLEVQADKELINIIKCG